jgi:hypothetical protein
VVLGKQDPFISVAVSFSALIFGFVLLVVIARVGGGRRSNRQVEEPAV